MPGSRRQKRIIVADKISGLEAAAFAVSICARGIELSNPRARFKFPFWAFSVPSGSDYGTEWVDNRGYEAVAARVLEEIKKPSGMDYFKKLQSRLACAEERLEKTARSLKSRLEALDDPELVRQYELFVEEYSRYWGEGVTTFLYEGIISEQIMQSLSARYPQAAAHLPELLRSPYRSFMFLSEQALSRIKREKNSDKRRELIRKYREDFFYLRANYGQAPEMTASFVARQLQHIKSYKAPARRSPVKMNMRLRRHERAVMELLKISEAIRDTRKQINLIGSYLLFRFLDEAARRHKVRAGLASRAFWFEYKDLILKTSKIMPVLKKRKRFSVGYDGQHCFYLDYLALKEAVKKSAAAADISGTPASGGLYRGRVRKILVSQDFSRFKKGEILVAAMTRPEFLLVMKKAGAIITDEGSLTSHAAIVARELSKPCVVGTKNATRLLEDGDLVEVDASQGIVKIIKKT